MAFTVRWVTARDNAKPVNMRDEAFSTKAEALAAIQKAGKLSRIDRFGNVYVVTPSKN